MMQKLNEGKTYVGNKFEPLEVLYEYDFPMIFTFLNINNEIKLAYWFGENLELKTDIYLVMDISEEQIDDLVDCKLPLKTLIVNSKPLEQYVVDFDGIVTAYAQISATCLSDEELPADGCMLYPPKKYVGAFLYNSLRTEVALIKKEKPEWQKGNFNAIGGKVEDGESYVAACVREFFEETGLQTKESDWKHKVTLIGKNWQVNFYSHYLNVATLIDSVKTTTDEEVRVFDINNLPINKLKNLKWLIPMCMDDDISDVVTVKDSVP